MRQNHEKPLRAQRPPRLRLASALFASALLTSALLMPPGAEAEMCALDPVPAATLLLPYFEVDLESPTGANTLFTVHNALPDPALAHVTLWTNYSLPTLDFDLFLTGYDVQVVDLRDAFDNGNLPVTADEQTDPTDSISPHGNRPQWDGSFTAPPDCVNFFPYNNPIINSLLRERIRNGHTGQPISSLDDQCLGADLGDQIARGYITIDNARRCSLEFPSDPGYFHPVNGVASDVNQLWGDYVIVDPSSGFEVRDMLVHIEADPSFNGTITSSGYTFYGRYTQPNGDDHREPLGSRWGARYLGGPFTGGTDWIVWRDSTSSDTPLSVACDDPPAWFPLDENGVVCFDEEENDIELCGPGEVDPTCFPYETQRVSVGEGDLSLPFSFGWCILDLGSDDNFTGDVDFPAEGSPLAQSYVAVSHSAAGVYAVGHQAAVLGHACDSPAEEN